MLSITLKQLELFVAVAETQSFSKAAKLLSFSQSVISNNIAMLEESLQTPLINRTNKKKIEITEDGQLFYQKAKEILSSCYTLQDLSSNKRDSDTIAIGAHTVPAHYMVTDLMNYYMNANTKVRFLLREGDNSDILTLLKQRKIDLGIICDSQPTADVKSFPIYHDTFVIGLPNTPKYQCLLKKSPSIHEILLKERIIWNQEQEALTSEFLEHLGLAKSDLRIVAEMSSEQLAKNAVIDGLGIALLSKITLKCALKSAEILCYEIPQPPQRSITIAFNSKSQLNTACRQFVDFLDSGEFDFEKCNRQ